MSMNPFDEIALEEALRLKERGHAKEVVAVTLGPSAAQETLRTALALGADRAIHVETDEELQPLTVAKLLEAVCARESPSLVLTGKQAIDSDASQTPQLLAARLGWPQAMSAAAVEAEGESVTVSRECDGGVEKLRLSLPAVVSADLRLNKPRFAKLQNIMKARKMPIERHTPADLGVAPQHPLKTLSVDEPRARAGGRRVGDVRELVQLLREDGVL